MKNTKPFPFERARRVTPAEVKAARSAIEQKLGTKRAKRAKRPGRPPKAKGEKYTPISIRLSPDVLQWAKREAKKRGVGYQTFLNETLEQLAQ